jgi:hypothetical protein
VVTIRPRLGFPEATRRWLAEGLIHALPRLRMDELFRQRFDMFDEADLISVAVVDDAVAGALASRWDVLPDGTRFLHITSQFVAERQRHGGIFRMSWRGHFTDLLSGDPQFPETIVLKTYNPVVYCAMRSFGLAPYVRMYPSVTDPQHPSLARLAAAIAAAVSPEHEFHPGSGVIRGAGVPIDLYPELPACRDAEVNAFFAERAGPGDRVLCLLQIPTLRGASTILRAFNVPSSLS